MRWTHRRTPILPSIAFAIASALGASGGCGMGDDGPPGPIVHVDAGTPRGDSLGGRVATPSVDPIPSTVCSESIAVQGSAAPGVTVFAVGGLAASGVTKEAHPTTGRFCLDIPLQLGVTNRIEVRAKDPARGISDPSVVTVTQTSGCSTEPPEPPPAPVPSKNVAHGVTPLSNVTPSEGNLALLTDGNESTTAVLDQPSWLPVGDAQVWLSLKLAQLTAVDRVVVKWRDSPSSGGYYAEKYKILVSGSADPGSPSLVSGAWTVVEDVTQGAGGDEEFTLTAPGVRHVALWLIEDASYIHPYEHFVPAEIEVWDVPAKTGSTEPTQTNTCASAGS